MDVIRSGACYDGRGVPVDYDKAFGFLTYANTNGSTWGSDFLGRCCFRGRGTRQDFTKARELVE